MSGDKLTPLQRRILRALAGRFTPPWTLTGGAALAGFHLKHRPTRDLDLFWHAQPVLGALPPPLLIDSPHEILVNKLCALLGRAELRDLLDLKALLESGLDLGRALAAAPQKDGGFSALTLAWVLKDLRPAAVARQYGLSDAEAAELATFHGQLIQRLLADTAPA